MPSAGWLVPIPSHVLCFCCFSFLVSFSLTNRYPVFGGVVVTDDFTAPFKHTLSFRTSFSYSVVPATAAHRTATVQSTTCFVALATCRTWKIHGRVLLAEVGRFLVVEKFERQTSRSFSLLPRLSHLWFLSDSVPSSRFVKEKRSATCI